VLLPDSGTAERNGRESVEVCRAAAQRPAAPKA
jgi:hypothetical protein